MHWRLDPARKSISSHLEESGLEPKACDQNGACTAVCPMGSSFDYLPHQVMRLVQLDARDRLLRSNAIWLCSDCGACTAACPQGVSVSGVFRELRRMAHHQHVTPGPEVEGVKSTHDAFLGELHGSGRISDARVAVSYKLRSGDIFTDLPLSGSLLTSRRMSFSVEKGGKGGAEAADLGITRERERILQRAEQSDLEAEARGAAAEKAAAEKAAAEKTAKVDTAVEKSGESV